MVERLFGAVADAWGRWVAHPLARQWFLCNGRHLWLERLADRAERVHYWLLQHGPQDYDDDGIPF